MSSRGQKSVPLSPAWSQGPSAYTPSHQLLSSLLPPASQQNLQPPGPAADSPLLIWGVSHTLITLTPLPPPPSPRSAPRPPASCSASMRPPSLLKRKPGEAPGHLPEDREPWTKSHEMWFWILILVTLGT